MMLNPYPLTPYLMATTLYPLDPQTPNLSININPYPSLDP